MNKLTTINFKVLKISRVYLEIILNNKYNAKLLKSNLTEDFKIDAEYSALAEDLSVVSKYGTTLKYNLVSNELNNEPVIFQTDKPNVYLIEELKNLGGKYDKDDNVWVLNDFVKDRVEDLEEIYNSSEISIEVSVEKERSLDSLNLFGYDLIKLVNGRDKGTYQMADVAIISGSSKSGGSANNPKVIISSDTVLRFKLPKKLFEMHVENHKNDGYEIKVI
ncbi:hypothetical protein [Shewanella baltica]|uniref:hypothetical protein n=1 Tax=Shewanella baltica TaxID=62322 RepID=UPI003D7C12C3